MFNTFSSVMDTFCASHFYDSTIPEGYSIAQSTDPEVLNLGCIEMGVPPSPEVTNMVLKSTFLEGLHQYPNPQSHVSKDLIQAIIHYVSMNRELQDVVLTHGSDSALHCILDSYFSQRYSLREGPIMIVTLRHTYPHFKAFAEKYPSILHRLFLFDNLKQIQAFLSESKHDGRQLVYLPNPAMNGDYFLPSEIGPMMDLYKQVLFVVDEAYFEYNALHYDECYPVIIKPELSTVSLAKPNLITIRTFSKCFALASVRVGYMIGSKSMISTLKRLINPKDVTEYAKSLCLGALKETSYYLEAARSIVLDRIPQILSRLPYASKGAAGPFIFLKFDSEDELKEMCSKLLHEHKILVRNKHSTMPMSARVTVPFKEKTCTTFIDAVISARKYDIVLWDLDQTLRLNAQDKELRLPCGYTADLGHHHFVVTNNTVDSDLEMIQKHIPFINDVWRPDFDRLSVAHGKDCIYMSGPQLTLMDFFELAKRYRSSIDPPDILISDQQWASSWLHMSELRQVEDKAPDFSLPDVMFYATWLRDHCKNKEWKSKGQIIYCGKDSVIGTLDIMNWLHERMDKLNIHSENGFKIAVIGDAKTDQRLSQAISADFKKISLDASKRDE